MNNITTKIDIERLPAVKSLLGNILSYYIYEEKGVEEIQINKFNEAIVLYSNGNKKTLITELNKKNWKVIFYYLSNIIDSKKYTDNSNLIATLPGNHRFVGTMGNSVLGTGILVAIRFFKEESKTNFKDFNIDKHIKGFLLKAILKKWNIFISGATSAGKTTFINLLIKHIPKQERIITADEANELKVPHFNKVQMQPNNYEKFLDLIVKSTPDRLVLGELSTQNVHAVEKFLTNGHNGFLMTMHADTPQLAVSSSFFAKFSKEAKMATSYEREINLLKERVDLVIQLQQNHRKQRALTHMYFPKTDICYCFPGDYQKFVDENLVLRNFNKLKTEIQNFINTKGSTTYREINKEFNIPYSQAKKIVPSSNIRKEVVNKIIKHNSNLSSKKLQSILEASNIFICRRHIRREKNKYKKQELA